jgi:beta-glucosidase/6-phospho-beta-glucosidase/beta-galactosidase
MTKFDEFGLPIPKQIPPMPKTKSSETKMNERIRELAREAGFYANPDIQKFEKFAELIIEECIEQVKDFYQEDELNCFNAAEKIKDHFGVKS